MVELAGFRRSTYSASMTKDDKLLIVEDNPLVAAAIEKAGAGLDIQIDIATDGWDAIEMLRTEQYTGIVVDTDLPRQSGYGVLTYLRQENGDDFTNVLVVTSADGETVRQRVSQHLHVIPKGDVDEITAAIKAFKA
jgi:DNA-binding response OmpR family regulator